MSVDPEGIQTSVQSLQDAGKVVVEAAGSVAGDRLRIEVDARASRAAVDLKTDIVDEVALRADRLAARLATAAPEDLVEDGKRLAQQAATFARREPMLVIAGAFTLGLLVPKVLEAVSSASDTTAREE